MVELFRTIIWKLHSDEKESRLSSNLPLGFGDSDNMNRSKEEKIHIPRIKWQCPPNFVVSYNWHVTAGEESEETGTQKLREMRVFLFNLSVLLLKQTQVVGITTSMVMQFL